VVTTAWMYLTPLFYDLTALPETLQRYIVRFNPMYYYITQFRELVIYGYIPWVGLIWRGGLISLIMLMFGTWIFIRNKDKMILHI